METKEMLDLITDLVTDASEIQFTIDVLEMYNVEYDIEDFKEAVQTDYNDYVYDNTDYSIFCRDIIGSMTSIKTNIENYVDLLEDVSDGNVDFIEDTLNRKELTDKEKKYCKSLGYDVI